MHGDGRGMSVGEAEQEHYFSPTRGKHAAAGPPAAGAAPRHGDQDDQLKRSQNGTVDPRTLTHAQIEQQPAPGSQEDIFRLQNRPTGGLWSPYGS